MKLTDRRDFVRSVAAELSGQEAREADVKMGIVLLCFSTVEERAKGHCFFQTQHTNTQTRTQTIQQLRADGVFLSERERGYGSAGCLLLFVPFARSDVVAGGRKKTGRREQQNAS